MSGKLQVRELERREGLSIYGDGNRSIIIVAADGVAPAVLGYSDAAATTAANPHFRWWLEQMDCTVRTAAARNSPLKVDTPRPGEIQRKHQAPLEDAMGADGTLQQPLSCVKRYSPVPDRLRGDKYRTGAVFPARPQNGIWDADDTLPPV